MSRELGAGSCELGAHKEIETSDSQTIRRQTVMHFFRQARDSLERRAGSLELGAKSGVA